MKPPPFRYIRPRTLVEALDLKAKYGSEARFLAGGQSLVPTLNFRLADPAVLIDINDIPDLDGITASEDSVRIDACARYVALERSGLVAKRLPLVAAALPHVAHPQIRTRGTIGGSLANADPASEMPAVALALDARLNIRSRGGDRIVPANDFFLGPLTTALADDEMLVSVDYPAAWPRSGVSFMEVSRRRGDFALAGVAVTLTLDANATCEVARIAICGASDRPVLATQAAEGLIGTSLTADDLAAAADHVRTEIDPMGSLQASPAFQRHLAWVLAGRALAEARSLAQGALARAR